MVLFSRLKATFRPYHIVTNDSVTTEGAAFTPTTFDTALHAEYTRRQLLQLPMQSDPR